MWRALRVVLLLCTALPAQRPPAPTELTGQPLLIQKTWFIGGTGNWDYLTMDPTAGRLYIAHGPAVQVVDVETGTVAGEIRGFQDAREIALDDGGQFGYVSDGSAAKVTVFDRATLQKVAEIATDPNPRSLVFEPQTKLLFVVRNDDRAITTVQANRGPKASAARSRSRGSRSSVTVIDTQSRTVAGVLLLPGTLGFAQVDQDGQIYINVTDRNQILRFDALSVARLLHREPETVIPAPANSAAAPARPLPATAVIDWTGGSQTSATPDVHLHFFNLYPACADPTGLAIDSAHMRLFAACQNTTLVVVNSGTGELVTSVPIGPDAQAIAFDSERGLIFSANGGGDGSLTIIRQNVTDTYSVIQTLPTRQRARTLAVNPETGTVYLVTDYRGVDLAHPGSIGTLKQTPVNGSFQVLVIGN